MKIKAGDVLFDRFRILSKIGEGGQGGVFRAEDRKKDRTIAIKELQISMISPSEADECFHRFKNEAELALKNRNIVESIGLGAIYGKQYLFIENSPGGRKFSSNDPMTANIVGAAKENISREQSDRLTVEYAYRQKKATFYFVMEYVQGQGLDILMEKTGILPLKQTFWILLEVAAALAYAHRQCVIHRDVKPSNILVDTERKQVKLTDFGIACFLNRERRTALGVVMGSVWYMSPEQVRGETRNVEKTSDIFSLGAVFYEMVTGRKPFTGNLPGQVMVEIVMNDPEPPGKICSELPPGVGKLIMDMLGKEPEKRPPDMQDVLRRFGTAVEGKKRIAGDGITDKDQVRGPVGIICHFCAGLVAKDDRFCPFCGKTLLTECSACGKPFRAGDRFCIFCGARYRGAGGERWEVYVEKGSMEGHSFSLKGEIVKIGRMIGGNDIELSTDGTISRYHARLYREESGFSLEGWDWVNKRVPTNGTYVNGSRAAGSGSRISLNDMDTIRLGDTFLVFRRCGQ
ncbi:MAG: protein kinase, partial [bacterium]|nr:protein kinase [bacterium]